jgi:aspartate/methionine/tyrosine aminotransferase
LSQFKTINSIPIPLDPKNNFTITLQELRREIVGRGLSVLLLSNPCNPTGQLIEG